MNRPNTFRSRSVASCSVCVNWKLAHLDALGARVLAVALAFPLGGANKPPDAIERVHREERGRHTTSKSRNSSSDRGGAERAGRGTLIKREGFFFLFLGDSLVAHTDKAEKKGKSKIEMREQNKLYVRLRVGLLN